MAFDPNRPTEHSLADAGELRAQLNGLKELIDAVPAGPPGPGFRLCGDWMNTSYSPGDVVLYGGNIYVCFEGSPNLPPEQDARWRLLSIVGPPGPGGPEGPPGPEGPQGLVSMVDVMNNTSGSLASVSTLNPEDFADPLMQVLAVKLNEVITVAKRM